MEKISWSSHLKNKDILQRVKGEKGIEGRPNGLVTMCVATAF
jgi:hypothetical protein